MFIKLKNDVVINTNYIVAIEPYDGKSKYVGDKFSHVLDMTEGTQWYITEEDYNMIAPLILLSEDQKLFPGEQPWNYGKETEDWKE